MPNPELLDPTELYHYGPCFPLIFSCKICLISISLFCVEYFINKKNFIRKNFSYKIWYKIFFNCDDGGGGSDGNKIMIMRWRWWWWDDDNGGEVIMMVVKKKTVVMTMTIEIVRWYCK
jgi:hypothetical protein